jgi:hypothetical protein
MTGNREDDKNPTIYHKSLKCVIFMCVNFIVKGDIFALWSKKMRLKEVANFVPKLTTVRPQDRTMVQKDAFKRSREFWPETDNF